MASVNPKLKAVIVASKTIHGEFSLRAIKDTKQTPVQLVLRQAGFVPGDVVEIALLEDRIDLDLKDKVEELEREISYLEDKIDRALYELG